MKSILELSHCTRKAFFRSIGTNTKGLSYYLSIAMKEAIKSKDYTVSFLDKYLDDSLFVSKEAKAAEMELLSTQIKRYLEYLSGMKIVKENYSEKVNLNGVEVQINADLVILHNNSIEVIKIVRTAPVLTLKAREPKNNPQNNLEMYLMSLLRESLIKELSLDEDTPLFVSFHHLKSKQDKGDNFDIHFSPKNQTVSIVSSAFSNEVKLLANDTVVTKPTLAPVSECESCDSCQYKNICFYKRPQNDLEKIKRKKKVEGEIKLTSSQHEAIMFEEGIVRINAGAGSGKTTVVAIRVTELIGRGYKPEDILLVTFTNKGAEEMREKIEFWLKKENVKIPKNSKFNITTFNGWGDLIVSENYKEMGYTDKPRLIEKVEKYDIIFELLSNHPIMEGYNYKNPLMNFRYSKGVVVKVDKAFDYIKGHFITSVESFKNEYKDITNHEDIYNLYLQYNAKLKEQNLLEYQDQVNLVVKLIDENPSCLEKHNYTHLIIDEYQDSDQMQLDLIMFLSSQSKFKSLMIVGDDSQSIFGFRNTTQEMILNFHLYFNDVIDIKMVDNFRSTRQIIELANEINSLNKNKIEKELKASGKEGLEPSITKHESQEDEHTWIANSIGGLVKTTKPEEIAVIARTKYELLDIAEKLKERGIPFVVDVPEPLLSNTNIHIAEGLARFFVDNECDKGVLEYLFAIDEGLNSSSLEEIKVALASEKASISIEDKLLSANTLELFFSKLEKIKDNDFQKFLTELREKNFKTINQVAEYLRKFIMYEDSKTVERVSEKYRAVTLTTAHTSKGKEYPIVFNTISKYSPGNDIEEERRLLFVSVTRAKDLLYITYHENPKNRNILASELENIIQKRRP